MTTIIAAASTAEPNEGWGKLLALIIGGLLFWAGTEAHKRYRIAQGKPLFPGSTQDPQAGVNSQVTDPDDPTSDPSRKGSPEGVKDLELFVRERLGTASTTQIIRAARARFRKSESTVKRAMRRVRTGGPQ